MSIEFMMAKVEVAFVEALRKDPDLAGHIFFFDDEEAEEEEVEKHDRLLGAHRFDQHRDFFAEDYAAFAVDAAGPDNVAAQWLRRATGDGAETLAFDGFTYGEPFLLSPVQVQEIAVGLRSCQGVAVPPRAAAAPGDGGDTPEVDDDIADLFTEDDEDGVSLVEFFEAAAKEGKAIVGGTT